MRLRTWFYVKECAEALGISKNEIYKLIKDKKINAVKYAGTWTIGYGDICEFEEKNEGYELNIDKLFEHQRYWVKEFYKYEQRNRKIQRYINNLSIII